MTSIRNTASSALLSLALLAAAPAAGWAGVGNADSSAGEEDDTAPAAPAPTAPTQAAPAQATPAQATPAQATPAQATPAKTAPVAAVPPAPVAVPVAAVAGQGDGDGRCEGDRDASRRPAPRPSAETATAARAVGEAETVAQLTAEGRALLRAEAKPLDAVSYCSTSAALADRGEFRAAIQAASMALFLGRQGGDARLMAHAARNLAYAYSLAGALDPAERWAAEALRQAASVRDARIAEAVVAPALKIQGDIALRRGRAAEAASLYRQATAKLGKAPLRPWFVLAEAQAALAQNDAARAGTLLADARQGAPATLEPALARAEGELALKQRDHAGAAARFQKAIDAAGDDAYVRLWALHGLARAKRGGGDRAAALAALGQAVEAAEAVRGRFRSEEFKAGFFGTVQDVFDDAIAQAFDAGRAELALDFSERSRSRALLDLLTGRVEPQGAGLTFVDRVAKPEPLASLRQDLPRDAAVVVYHVLADRTLAWVLRPGELRGLSLAAGRAPLATAVGDLLDAVRNDAPDVRQRAALLHTALVAPLGLKPDEALLAVAHDALYMLPFGLLDDGKGWLIERRAVAMLPSLNAMRTLLHDRPAATGGALVVGNPDVGNPIYDLPAAEQEAAAIARRVPGATLLTRGAATKQRLMAEAPGRRLVHIAAHAVVDRLDPLASPIYLAGQGTDAAMTARDFYRVDLGATRLIALSACETGLGTIGRGNEFWGFQRTLLAAGARGMLVSLWPVEDESTAQLMTRFYDLVATRPLAAALREAQLDLVRRYRDQPILWASFVLVGDWR